MSTSNRYAPPRANVRDVADPTGDDVQADRGTRLLAMILDSLIFGAMVYVPLLVAGGMSGAFSGRASLSAIGFGWLLPVVGIAVWIVLTIKYVAANGQSIGKKMLGIKVVRSDGSPASLGRIFWLRNVVNTVLGIIPLYGFVDALLIFGEQRQCVHDKLADTIVIKA